MTEISMQKILTGVFLVSLICAPAVYAVGHWATVADAFWSSAVDVAEILFGESVTAVGDFNNDGYDDLVVGTRLFNSGQPGSGRVWVFNGSATGPASTPSLTINPPVIDTNGWFGKAVAVVNAAGDAYDDLLVGMPNYDAVAADDGAVFLYYGSGTGLDANWDWRVTGDALYAHTGLAVASAGNVDNDDYEDIIIGARRYDACNGAAPIINHAYVFFGSNSLVGTTTVASADWYAIGDQCVPYADAAFGENVGSAGDVNGDGYDDIFVGAHAYDSGQADEGKIFVYHGSASGLGATGTPSNADWTAESDMASVYFPDYSRTVVGSGDVNGDGYDDIIAGTRYYDHMQTDDGALFAWYGSDTGLGDNGTPSNADWMAYGTAMLENFASNVAVFDYNGDSYDDVLVGALGHVVDSQASTGMAAIWLGTEDGLSTGGPSYYADWMAEGDPQPLAYFGWSLSTGDTDGDELEDMIIGAPYYDLVNSDAGKLWAFPGEPTVFRENFETGDTLRCSKTAQ